MKSRQKVRDKMTREEAINNLKDFIDTYLTCHGEEDTVAVSLDNVDVEALDIAIKALEQEPCEDAVSMQVVLDMATTIQTDDCSGNEIMEVVETDGIKALPSVTPTRKKGKWIPRRAKYDNVVPIYECSICHKDNGFEDTNYCPHCGAEMEV